LISKQKEMVRLKYFSMEMKTFGFGTKIIIIETKRSIQIEKILKEKNHGWFWEKFQY
jgi:hypothetical protein